MLRRWRARLLAAWNWRRKASDLDDEIQFHLAEDTEERTAAGVPEEQAKVAALKEFGNVSLVREAARDVWGWGFAERVWQDLRYGLRALKAAPVVSVVTILSVALGIGTSTAVFSVVDGVLLKPLPVRDQERLLVIWKAIPARGTPHWPFSYASYEGMRGRLRTASGLAAHPMAGAVPATLEGVGEGRRLQVAGVTGDWFDVLGVEPRAGRLLTAQDDHVGVAPVVVLSSGEAERVFGSVSGALGRSVRLNDMAYTIVGITPAGFDFPRGTEAWVSATPWFSSTEGVASLYDANRVAWDLVMRVAPGVTLDQARAELTSALSTLTTESTSLTGSTGTPQIIRATPFLDVAVGDVRPQLLLLSGAVLLVFVVAGVNVASLLLVRGLTRRRELTVRSAIGASRSRILRQLATEALLVSVAGAGCGVFVAYVALHALLLIAPIELPRVAQIQIDGRALVFTGASAMIVVLVFGVLPLQATRLESSRALRAPDDAPEPGTSRMWLRHSLVIGQIAITVLVLSMAGLLLRSLDRMQRVDVGFAAQDVVLVEITTPSQERQVGEAQRAMIQLAEQVATLPGVSHASTMLTYPFAGTRGADILTYADGQSLDETSNPLVHYEGADPAYFTTLGIPILHGRGIDEHDRADSQLVVVVNEAFTRLFWSGADPVGRRVKFGRTTETGDWHAWRTVVGLVADTRYRELTEARPTVYVPYEQGIPVTPCCLAVRTANTAVVANAIRRVVHAEQPSAMVTSITPMSQLLAEPLARPRFQSALVLTFATLGLVLSVIGTYGLLAFHVRQRTREIGIRMALGADASRVRRLVLQHGALIGMVGVFIGLAAAVTAGRLVQPLLFEVSTTDPLVLSGAATALIVAILAATLPATRSAARTDPLIVMRGD